MAKKENAKTEKHPLIPDPAVTVLPKWEFRHNNQFPEKHKGKPGKKK